MSSLKSRKQLLLMESELNRAQLIQEWKAMADDVRVLTRKAKTIGSLASASAVVVAGLSFFRRKKTTTTVADKPGWWQTILKGAGLASTLWAEFRSPDREPRGK